MTTPFIVVSDSMHPLIKVGQSLQISTNLSGLKAFDIILFRRKSQLTVHYIWRDQKAYNSSVITRSLKDFYRDEEPVPYNEIVGVVTNFQINRWTRLKILVLCALRRSL